MNRGQTIVPTYVTVPDSAPAIGTGWTWTAPYRCQLEGVVAGFSADATVSNRGLTFSLITAGGATLWQLDLTSEVVASQNINVILARDSYAGAPTWHATSPGGNAWTQALPSGLVIPSGAGLSGAVEGGGGAADQWVGITLAVVPL